MPPSKPRPASTPNEAVVVTKATLRAASRLGLTNKVLAAMIGVSEATVSRMRNGDYLVQQSPPRMASSERCRRRKSTESSNGFSPRWTR